MERLRGSVPASVPYTYRRAVDHSIAGLPYDVDERAFLDLNPVDNAVLPSLDAYSRALGRQETACLQLPVPAHERVDYDVVTVGGAAGGDPWRVPPGMTLAAVCSHADGVRNTRARAQLVPISPLEVWYLTVNASFRSRALGRAGGNVAVADDHATELTLAAGDEVWIPRPAAIQYPVHVAPGPTHATIRMPHWVDPVFDYLVRIRTAAADLKSVRAWLVAVHSQTAALLEDVGKAHGLMELLLRHHRSREFPAGNFNDTNLAAAYQNLGQVRSHILNVMGYDSRTLVHNPSQPAPPCMRTLGSRLEAHARELSRLLSDAHGSALVERVLREATRLGQGFILNVASECYQVLGDAYKSLFESGSDSGNEALQRTAARFRAFQVPDPNTPAPSLDAPFSRGPFAEGAESQFWVFTHWLSGPWARWKSVRDSILAPLHESLKNYTPILLGIIGGYELTASTDSAVRIGTAQRIGATFVNYSMFGNLEAYGRAKSAFDALAASNRSTLATTIQTMENFRANNPLVRMHETLATLCSFLSKVNDIHTDRTEVLNARVFASYAGALAEGSETLNTITTLFKATKWGGELGARVAAWDKGLSKVTGAIKIVKSIAELVAHYQDTEEDTRFAAETAILWIKATTSVFKLALKISPIPILGWIVTALTALEWAVTTFASPAPAAVYLMKLVSGARDRRIVRPRGVRADSMIAVPSRLLELIDPDDVLAHRGAEDIDATVDTPGQSPYPLSHTLRYIQELGNASGDNPEARSPWFYDRFVFVVEYLVRVKGYPRDKAATWIRYPNGNPRSPGRLSASQPLDDASVERYWQQNYVHPMSGETAEQYWFPALAGR